MGLSGAACHTLCLERKVAQGENIHRLMVNSEWHAELVRNVGKKRLKVQRQGRGSGLGMKGELLSHDGGT